MRTKGEAHELLDVVHRLCLEAEPTVRMPPDTPVHICELFATLGVTVQGDATLPPYREVRAGRG